MTEVNENKEACCADDCCTDQTKAVDCCEPGCCETEERKQECC